MGQSAYRFVLSEAFKTSVILLVAIILFVLFEGWQTLLSEYIWLSVLVTTHMALAALVIALSTTFVFYLYILIAGKERNGNIYLKTKGRERKTHLLLRIEEFVLNAYIKLGLIVYGSFLYHYWHSLSEFFIATLLIIISTYALSKVRPVKTPYSPKLIYTNKR